MIIAVLPLVGAACSSASGSQPLTGVCADYAKARPLIAQTIAMDAKIRAGDMTGAQTDAAAIVKAIGTAPVQTAKAEDPTDQKMMEVQLYQVLQAIWTQAQAVVAGTLNAATLDDFETNLKTSAFIADNYSTGKGHTSAICPGLPIPSPYTP